MAAVTPLLRARTGGGFAPVAAPFDILPDHRSGVATAFSRRISGLCIEMNVVPSPAMTPPPELRGAVLGRGYRLGHAVEGEDMVFEATHERVPGKVIVRVFPNESLSRPAAGARIHQAVRRASLLRATHASQLLDFNLAGSDSIPSSAITFARVRPSTRSL